MTAPDKKVESLPDLVAAVELVGVTFIELRAERVAPREVDPDSMQIAIAQEVSSEVITLSFQGIIKMETADLVAAVQTRFAFTNPTDASSIPEPVLEEFIEKLGIMTAYPYIRQGIHTLSTMLGIAPVTVGLLRAGTFELNANDSESVPADDNQPNASRSDE